MPRSNENIPLGHRIKLTAEILGVGAVAAWSLLFPAKAGQDSSGKARREGRADNVPARTAAAALDSNLRRGLPVPYDANIGVEFPAMKPDGTEITEITIAPLTLTVGGNKEYFRLIGHSVPTLRAVRIPDPIDTVPEVWEPQNPGVTVESHRGVIGVSDISRIPAGAIHLSNGHAETVAIGQTSATP